jgi:hypothetical protein
VGVGRLVQRLRSVGLFSHRPLERRLRAAWNRPSSRAIWAGIVSAVDLGGNRRDRWDGSRPEVRFRAGVDVEGGELTPRIVRSLAAACVVNIDLYRPAIRAVADGAMNALEALEDVGR